MVSMEVTVAANIVVFVSVVAGVISVDKSSGQCQVL